MLETTKWCVYIHTNIFNNKKYVGQTCQLVEARWRNGKGYLNKNKSGDYLQPAFANAIIKYGWENFAHEVYAQNLTKDEADSIEKELISIYQTTDSDFGYNIQIGGTPDISGEKNPMYGHTKEFMTMEERYHRGDGVRGTHRSQETKDKISKSNKEYYKHHQHHTKGSKRSQEFKELMHEKMTGRIFSEETKNKMSKNHADITGGKNPRAKKVRCIETKEIFNSAAEAGRKYNLAPSNPGADIRKSCTNRKYTAGKKQDTNEPLHWEWID